MNEEMLAGLEKEINAVVDKWVSETLKDHLIKGTDTPQSRSLWDRLKQGISNWWYGPQGEAENKYRWKNRFGHSLGSEEVKESSEFVLFTLHEYSEMKSVVESVEEAFNENQDPFMKLKLMRILTAAAAELKIKLFGAIKNKLAAMKQAPEAAPEKAPQAEPQAAPEKTPEAERQAEPQTTIQKAPEADPQAATNTPEVTSSSGRVPTSRVRSSKSDKKDPVRSTEVSRKSDKKEKAVARISNIDKAKEAEKEDSGEAGSANESLSAYLQDEKSGRRYELGDSVKNITGFLKSVQAFIKSPELKKWWLEKQQEYIDKLQKNGAGEAFLQMWDELVRTDSIVEEIEKITGVAKANIKKMMAQYIEEKEARLAS